MAPISRSLLGFVFACVLLATPSLASAQMSGKPIRIGVLADLSGGYKDVGGQGSVEAAKMAAEEFGNAIGDVKIEVLSADAQDKPDISSAIARRWYDEQGVGIILDLPASSVGLAVQQVARERTKISVVTGGGSSDLTGKDCSPTGFHWVWDTYAMSHGAGDAVVKAGGKTWFFITGDFAAGITLQREASEAAVAVGGSVVGSVRAPFGTTDYSSQVLRAQQSGAQIVALAMAGTDEANAIKQAAEFGVMPKQQIVGLITYISDVHALGLQTTAGMRFMTGFYWDTDDETRAWSRKFAARMGGAMPTMSQAGVYSATRHYLQAIRDSGTDDTLRVVAKMKATPINDTLAHGGKLREDGLMEHDLLLVQVKTPAESKYPWDYYSITRRVPGDAAFKSMADAGCPLVRK